MGATGRVLEAAGQSRVARLAERGGLLEAVFRGDPYGAAVAAAPTVARVGGRLLQRVGDWLTPGPDVTDLSVPVRPSALTSAQLAERIRSGTGEPADRSPIYAPTPTPGSVAPPAAAPGAPAPPGAPDVVPAAPTPPAGPQSTTPTPSLAKLKLSVAEGREYVRLRGLGKTHAEAADLIQAQRAFLDRFGLSTAEEARQAVAARNVSGTW